MINTVRSVAPDKPIRVDANEGWKDKETAIKKIEWLAKNGVEFVEQPMPSVMLERPAGFATASIFLNRRRICQNRLRYTETR
jgi:L-alanine-DL-glutamate epimerase-like enolase superfamily enzyme